MESADHGRAARRHEMWFSAPVGVVHERAGDDGSNAVQSGSCRGALWWPLWYSSVAGQVRFAFPLPVVNLSTSFIASVLLSCSLVTRQVQSAEQTLFSKREEEGDAPVRSHSGVCDAVLRLLSGGHIAAPQIAQYCNPFLPLLIFCRKESGAFRLDVPFEFDLVPFQIILCSAT
ncbi:hypothetical protein VPH35_095395 [Triticum aestivum]